MNPQGTEIWQAVSDGLQRLRGRKPIDLWLSQARPAAFRRGLFLLDVRSGAAKAALDARYVGDLEALFLELTGSPVRVLVRVAAEGADGVAEGAAPVLAASAALSGARAAPRGMRRPAAALRPERFVVTAANRLAHRAAERFVLAPAAGWNPLFVYGPPGCGKTDLARFVLARLRAAGEAQDPLVLSGPALTRDASRAARTGGLPALRADWDRRDAVVLDEAHRLRGQRRAQAEAIALIERALARSARVLVLSRHAPQSIVGADPRLLSWFLGGMVVSLAEPDRADREAVLGEVARELPVAVMPGVVPALAERCRGSLADAVRVLQGAAHDAAQQGRALDLELFDRRLATPSTVESGLGAVVALVSAETGVPAERIRSAEKARPVVEARHLCAYLASHSLGLPTRQVCRSLGQASASLVGYARRIVEARRAADPGFDARVHALVARLQGAQRDFAW